MLSALYQRHKGWPTKTYQTSYSLIKISCPLNKSSMKTKVVSTWVTCLTRPKWVPKKCCITTLASVHRLKCRLERRAWQGSEWPMTKWWVSLQRSQCIGNFRQWALMQVTTLQICIRRPKWARSSKRLTVLSKQIPYRWLAELRWCGKYKVALIFGRITLTNTISSGRLMVPKPWSKL